MEVSSSAITCHLQKNTRSSLLGHSLIYILCYFQLSNSSIQVNRIVHWAGDASLYLSCPLDLLKDSSANEWSLWFCMRTQWPKSRHGKNSLQYFLFCSQIDRLSTNQKETPKVCRKWCIDLDCQSGHVKWMHCRRGYVDAKAKSSLLEHSATGWQPVIVLLLSFDQCGCLCHRGLSQYYLNFFWRLINWSIFGSQLYRPPLFARCGQWEKKWSKHIVANHWTDCESVGPIDRPLIYCQMSASRPARHLTFSSAFNVILACPLSDIPHWLCPGRDRNSSDEFSAQLEELEQLKSMTHNATQLNGSGKSCNTMWHCLIIELKATLLHWVPYTW